MITNKEFTSHSRGNTMRIQSPKIERDANSLAERKTPPRKRIKLSAKRNQFRLLSRKNLYVTYTPSKFYSVRKRQIASAVATFEKWYNRGIYFLDKLDKFLRYIILTIWFLEKV
ncbi:hypothetical protein X798_03753 [Onchocerca flexuosa]|uniref:Uncharacterized protein n=1 Tax=Onchocerca flexuosa TaxID=387005 RepID=A0A238BV41_9BILA|nr:hypothetical protein X798_03753 [Onchocerca flexuosa]